MNVVSDDEVWFYYYTEFNLAKIQNNQVEMISTDIQGSDGFVKHGSYFLFRGGYNFQNLYYLYELTNTGLKEKLQIIFTDELNNLIVAEKIHCRGSFLLIQNRTQLFKFDLREILNKHKIQ